MDAELLKVLPPALHGCLTPLSGGLTNSSYRLTTEQGHYWLRRGRLRPHELGIDRYHELIAHRAAAGAGLAPAIRFCEPQSGILVLDWLDEPDWRRQPGSLEALMPRVAQLHQLIPAGLPVLNLPERVRHYRQQLSAPPSWLTPLMAHFDRPELNPDFVPTLCHCDLTAGNLMGSRPWLVDWEYAALADPAFELAVIADDRGLSEQDCTGLLTHYRAAGGSMNMARLRARLHWVKLLTLLWALVQYQHTGEAEYATWVDTARKKLTSFQ
ncbi:choline kinase family protein [Oceanimonas marisflavi]|uniref:choline kinase family protein n=1 Tax=Oceanimonas marisflavi TaxID=2059724 RepID=UPI000D30C09E|nr:phosphotransferase [Oceanimonas marisflavi]